jgi:YD repeat-containing protein
MAGELDQGEYIADDDHDGTDITHDWQDGGNVGGGDGNGQVVRDNNGRITSVDTGNGTSIEYNYDDQGNIKNVTDTGSGTKIERQDDGSWAVVGPDGSKQPIDGNVTVDQNSGSVSAHLNNGTQVTTSPNGDVTVVAGKLQSEQMAPGAGGDKSQLK